MASIGEVTLEIRSKRDGSGTATVTYEVHFDRDDRATRQAYAETCRLIGDDTGTGDGRLAGGDDTRGFFTPLFNAYLQAASGVVKVESADAEYRFPRSPKVMGQEVLSKRVLTKSFTRADLDEDRFSTPNPDELRALVTLVPKGPGGTPARRESNLVALNL